MKESLGNRAKRKAITEIISMYTPEEIAAQNEFARSLRAKDIASMHAEQSGQTIPSVSETNLPKAGQSSSTTEANHDVSISHLTLAQACDIDSMISTRMGIMITSRDASSQRTVKRQFTSTPGLDIFANRLNKRYADEGLTSRLKNPITSEAQLRQVAQEIKSRRIQSLSKLRDTMDKFEQDPEYKLNDPDMDSYIRELMIINKAMGGKLLLFLMTPFKMPIPGITSWSYENDLD